MTNSTKFARFRALLAASLFAAALPALYGCAALRAESAASTEGATLPEPTPPWTFDVSCWNAICG